MCVVTRTCLGASGAPSSSSNIVTVGEAILRNLRSKGIRAIGLLSWALVLVGGFALLFVVFNFQETADFFTENVSPDGHIQNYLRLYVVSFTLPVYLIVFGLVLWQLLRIGYFSGGQAIFSFRHRPLNPNPGLDSCLLCLGRFAGDPIPCWLRSAYAHLSGLVLSLPQGGPLRDRHFLNFSRG